MRRFASTLALASLAASACTTNESIRPDRAGAGVGASGSAGAPGAAGAPAGAAGGDAASGGGAAAGAAAGKSGAPAAGAAGVAGAGPLVCPSARGPKMVPIDLPGVARFCIDSTEVSQAQYAEFLDAKVDPKLQSRPNCAKQNATFAPIENQGPEDWKDCPKGTYDPTTKGNLPVNCVDHCDAIAYCEWAGKRLCGSLAGGSLEGTGEDAATLKKGEWYAACSQGGKTPFPYGDVYAKGKCGEPAPQGSATPPDFVPVGPNDCRGQGPPFDAVFDLVGNIAEWEDLCDGNFCSVRGGGAGLVVPPPMDCLTVGDVERYNRGFVGVGVRCCASGQ